MKESIQETAQKEGEFEVDESYFEARRIRGKRGRGAAGKTPVFGLLKRSDKVYVSIVPSPNEFARGKSHVNGTSEFFEFCKTPSCEIQWVLFGKICATFERV